MNATSATRDPLGVWDGIPPTCANSTLVRPQPPFHAPRVSFNAFVLALGVAAVATLVPLFVVNQRKLERLRVRRLQTVVTTALGLLVVVFNAALPFLIPGGGAFFPCNAQLVLDLVTVPLIASTFLSQLYTFYFLTMFSRVARSERPDLERIDVDLQDSFLEKLTAAISSLAVSPDQEARIQRGDKRRFLRALRFFISGSGLATFGFFLLVPFLVLAGALTTVDPAYAQGCTGCYASDVETIFIIVEIVGLLAWGAWLAFVVRTFPDPWGLARECSLMMVCATVGVVGFLLQTFDDASRDPAVAFDYDFLMALGVVGMLFVQTALQVYWGGQTMQWRSWLARITGSSHQHPQTHQEGAPVSSSAMVAKSPDPSTTHFTTTTEDARLAREMASDAGPRLRAILSDAQKRVAFEDFLARECGLESLYALQSIGEFRLAYSDLAPGTRDARARKIVRSYIASDALFVVNVAHSLSESVRTAVDRGSVPRNVFDPLRQELTLLLEHGAVARFEHSTSGSVAATSSRVGTTSMRVSAM